VEIRGPQCRYSLLPAGAVVVVGLFTRLLYAPAVRLALSSNDADNRNDARYFGVRLVVLNASSYVLDSQLRDRYHRVKFIGLISIYHSYSRETSLADCKWIVFKF